MKKTKQAIAPDGTSSLPLLGRVKAQGQTLSNNRNGDFGGDCPERMVSEGTK